MSAKTESEALFEDLCSCHHIKWSRVPSQRDVKTPDYEIIASDGRLVVVEVKQFDPNREEKDALTRLDQWDSLDSPNGLHVIDFPVVKPGDRIRDAIRTADLQIKAVSKDTHPALLVVFNNVPHNTVHTDPYAMLTAMRGLDAIPILVPDDPSAEPVFLPMHPGPEKMMTPSADTSISAIGVLYRVNAGVPALDVYHNRFAKIALRHSDLAQAPEIRHFKMRDDENGWDLLHT